MRDRSNRSSLPAGSSRSKRRRESSNEGILRQTREQIQQLSEKEQAFICQEAAKCRNLCKANPIYFLAYLLAIAEDIVDFDRQEEDSR